MYYDLIVEDIAVDTVAHTYIAAVAVVAVDKFAVVV